MKVEQLSDLALDCIHSAARALDDRYWPALYGEVVKGLETIETDALFTIRRLAASAQRQVLTGLATSPHRKTRQAPRLERCIASIVSEP
jgi:hypothetical protein